MNSVSKSLSVALLPLLVTGCFFSSSKDEDDGSDLDVPMEPSFETSTNEPTQTAKAIPANAVVDWQNFFKPAPAKTERAAIEQRLEAWKDTEDAATLVEKGRQEQALGRLAAAETSFRKALRLDDGNRDAKLELAALYLRKGEVQKAFDFLAEVRDAIGYSDDVTQSFLIKYRYTLALGYLARGERAKGHKVLSDLIGVHKGFSPAYAALASSYLEQGKDGVAEFVTRRGLDRAKESPALYNLMGVIAQRKNNAIEARSWFEKALALDKTYAPALINRASLAIADREYEAAEQDLHEALLYDPNNVQGLVALGIVQKKQGRFSDARATFTKAIDIDPDDATARFNLAVLEADDLKRPNVALRLFHEVVQAAPAGSEIGNKAKSYIQDLRRSQETY